MPTDIYAGNPQEQNMMDDMREGRLLYEIM